MTRGHDLIIDSAADIVVVAVVQLWFDFFKVTALTEQAVVFTALPDRLSSEVV